MQLVKTKIFQMLLDSSSKASIRATFVGGCQRNTSMYPSRLNQGCLQPPSQRLFEFRVLSSRKFLWNTRGQPLLVVAISKIGPPGSVV
jgi:hypothetical protein